MTTTIIVKEKNLGFNNRLSELSNKCSMGIKKREIEKRERILIIVLRKDYSEL